MATVQPNRDILGGATLAEEAARLLEPLRALKRRLAAKLLLGEVANLLFTLLAGALLAMTLDATLRWRTPWPRWSASILVLAAVLVILGRALLRRSWSFGLESLSAHLENLFPTLRGKLYGAVTVAASPRNDLLLGSPSLQARLIKRASQSLSQIDLAAAVVSRSSRIQLILLSFCSLTLAIWTIAAPPTVWQAARRFMAPWRIDAWPRLVILELSAPAKVARGADVSVFVEAKKGPLPATATLHIVSENGDVIAQPMRRQTQRFAFSISKVKGPLWIRAAGGDDDQMRWRRVDVVEPVSLSATKLEAIPPAYMQAPSFPVGAEMTLLEGTRLLMEFRASRPIDEAMPVFLGKAKPRLKVDASGRIAKGEINLSAASSAGSERLQIDIRDRDDAVVPAAWIGSIKVLPDSPPTILWESPRPMTKVQPQSRLTLNATAKDDVRLASLLLRRRIVKLGGETTPWQVEATLAIPDGAKESAFLQEADLAAMQVAPGEAVEWTLVATDAKGQVKESEALRCVVVAAEDLRKEVEQRLDRFLEQLHEILRRQRDITAELEIAEATKADSAHRIAAARAAQFEQQSLGGEFSGKSSAILETWIRLVEEQQLHQFLSETDQSTVNQITQDLTSIAEQNLPAVQRELERVQSLHAEGQAAQASLTKATELASGAAERIAEVANRLSHWQRWSRTAQTVGELLNAEQELQSLTREAAPKLFGRLPEELDDEEAKLLRELAEKQSRLREQLAELPPPGQDLQADPEAWRSLRDLADSQMSQAARDIALNQLNQADSHQSQALEAIKKLADERASHGPGRNERQDSTSDTNQGPQPPRTGPTEAQLKEVIDRQTALHEKTRKALSALKQPRANKTALEAELAELAKAQSELAAQVETWRKANEERPHE